MNVDLQEMKVPFSYHVPISGLYKVLCSTCLFPLYLNKAARCKDAL